MLMRRTRAPSRETFGGFGHDGGVVRRAEIDASDRGKQLKIDNTDGSILN